MMRRSLLVALVAAADADVYMQYPPGSNNRLAEGGGNRNNNNRSAPQPCVGDDVCPGLGGIGSFASAAAFEPYPPSPRRLMDTQNNAKGGYGYGGAANNKADPVTYMAGSKLSMSWTSQHSCGSENAECQIVIQYMCASRSPAWRDGGVGESGLGAGEACRDGGGAG